MGNLQLLSGQLPGGRPGAPLLVSRPIGRVVSSELVQIPPGEQAGVVSVVEDEFDGILSDRLDSADPDVFLSEHQHFLTRAMPFDFGGGRMHPQVLEGQLEPAAVRKSYFQQPGFAAYFDFSRDRVGHMSVSIGTDL
jgi:hypothetical protein